MGEGRSGSRAIGERLRAAARGGEQIGRPCCPCGLPVVCRAFAVGVTSRVRGVSVRLACWATASPVGCVGAFAGVSTCWEVGVRMLVELERVFLLADVEFDEFTCGVLVDDDGCALSAAAPEKRDVAAGGFAAGELFRVRVEGEAIAGHHRLRSLAGSAWSWSRLHWPQLYDRTRQGGDTVR